MYFGFTAVSALYVPDQKLLSENERVEQSKLKEAGKMGL